MKKIVELARVEIKQSHLYYEKPKTEWRISIPEGGPIKKFIQLTKSVFKKKEKGPPKIYITKRHIFVCDQGHYGSTTCGNCGTDVDNYPFQCPKCGYWFERKHDVSYNEGGSDF